MAKGVRPGLGKSDLPGVAGGRQAWCWCGAVAARIRTLQRYAPTAYYALAAALNKRCRTGKANSELRDLFSICFKHDFRRTIRLIFRHEN